MTHKESNRRTLFVILRRISYTPRVSVDCVLSNPFTLTRSTVYNLAALIFIAAMGGRFSLQGGCSASNFRGTLTCIGKMY